MEKIKKSLGSSFIKKNKKKIQNTKLELTQLETQPLQGQQPNKIKILKIKYHLILGLVNEKNKPKFSFLIYFLKFSHPFKC